MKRKNKYTPCDFCPYNVICVSTGAVVEKNGHYYIPPRRLCPLAKLEKEGYV
jgi:hypothetical protein